MQGVCTYMRRNACAHISIQQTACGPSGALGPSEPSGRSRPRKYRSAPSQGDFRPAGAASRPARAASRLAGAASRPAAAASRPIRAAWSPLGDASGPRSRIGIGSGPPLVGADSESPRGRLGQIQLQLPLQLSLRLQLRLQLQHSGPIEEVHY